MRICFLHIGVYKTGSSSIQWALYTQRVALAKRGYLLWSMEDVVALIDARTPVRAIAAPTRRPAPLAPTRRALEG